MSYDTQTVEAPKAPTQKDIRNYNKVFTTRVLPEVEGCGHKVDPDAFPRLNCHTCWGAFFNNHVEWVNNADELLRHPNGKEVFISLNGKQAYKFFIKFMKLMKELNEKQTEIAL
jgi:hypothetical protein